MKLSKLSLMQLVKVSIVAAIYVALTLSVAPISYGALQFRVSEVLNLLAFINPLYGISLVLGCAISNLFSPLGMYDVVFGTLATLLSVIFISKSKNLFVASLWPSLFNPIIVGLELYFLLNLPFAFTAFTILIGEFMVVTVVGYPLFKILMRNSRFSSMLKDGKIVHQ